MALNGNKGTGLEGVLMYSGKRGRTQQYVGNLVVDKARWVYATSIIG